MPKMKESSLSYSVLFPHLCFPFWTWGSGNCHQLHLVSDSLLHLFLTSLFPAGKLSVIISPCISLVCTDVLLHYILQVQWPLTRPRDLPAEIFKSKKKTREIRTNQHKYVMANAMKNEICNKRFTCRRSGS